jgi:hypothetical protein
MSFWNRAATRIRALLTRAEAPVTSRVMSIGRTKGGEYIDANAAMRQSVVWACLAY